jgi:hypothetical protein
VRGDRRPAAMEVFEYVAHVVLADREPPGDRGACICVCGFE